LAPTSTPRLPASPEGLVAQCRHSKETRFPASQGEESKCGERRRNHQRATASFQYRLRMALNEKIDVGVQGITVTSRVTRTSAASTAKVCLTTRSACRMPPRSAA